MIYESGGRQRTGWWAAGMVLGLMVLGFGWWKLDRTGGCGSDFAAFYAGGKLVWEGRLYDQKAVVALQREVVGCKETGNAFIRLPFFAVVMSPLAALPYPVALIVWKVGLGGAVLAFIWLWPGERWRTGAVVAWSFPMMTGLAYGQDVAFLLVAVAAGFGLMRKERWAAAGMALSWGFAKPHLFIWAPLLAAARGRWTVAGGAAAGGCALALLSFLPMGYRWVEQFIESAAHGGANPHLETMANFRGLAAGLGQGWAVEAALSGVFLAVLARPLARLEFERAASLALAASVVVGHHSYFYDLVFVIPLILLILEGESPGWLRSFAWLMALPVLPLLPVAWEPHWTTQIATPVFVAAAGWGLMAGQRVGAEGRSGPEKAEGSGA